MRQATTNPTMMAANRNLFISYLLPDFQSSNCSSFSYDHIIIATPFCCLSFTKSQPTLCDPMDRGTPGFPILPCFLEFAQIHVHWLSDAILCHPLLLFCLQSFLASGSFPMSLLFASCGQSIGASASVLAVTNQGWFPLGWTGLISLQPNGLRSHQEL